MMRVPISVLCFSNSVVRGGAEEHILTLLRGLDRAYFRLHLVCTPECAEKLKADLPNDVHLVPLSFQAPYQQGAAVRFAQLLCELRVDIMHSHGFHSSLVASPIGWLCRVPLIIETPHSREQWRRGWLKGRFLVDRWIGRFVDYFIAVSEANSRYLQQQKGLPKEKIVVIRNGCDLEAFQPDRPRPLALKRSLGIEDSDQILLIIGRLEPQKGHSVMLNALPVIRRRFPTTHLIFVGEGALRTELERQATALGVGEFVHFVGYQKNVPDWLALADLIVLPSYYEGLPLVAIESLAAGKPIIATAVDGTPEVVVDGKTGLLVPPGGATGLSDAICKLLCEPGLGVALGRTGRQWVLQHFSSTRQIQQTQELYIEAWQRSPRRGKVADWLAPTVCTTGRQTSPAERVPLVPDK